jgi:uncharacterized damage-inducible protein DinB
VKAHFTQLAEYNAWANERLYRQAGRLSDEEYRRDVGAFFKSMHLTLNHLLAADRIWMRRLTGTGEAPAALNAIVCDDLPSLTAARRREDERLVQFVAGLTDAQFAEPREYRMLSGVALQNELREILAHMFTHHAHHRGQAHMILTVLGVAEPEPWDFLIKLMERRPS